MKRWIWAAMAVAPMVAGAIWWALPDTTDVAVITAINPDGTVRWVDGEIRPAGENNSVVHELPGETRVSRLADDVVIHTPFGCGESQALSLTWLGMDAVECTRADFLAKADPPYAPRLTFNGRWRHRRDSGEIPPVARTHQVHGPDCGSAGGVALASLQRSHPALTVTTRDGTTASPGGRARQRHPPRES